MSTNKKTRKELLDIEVRVNELDRAQAYLNKEFYENRKTQLLERKDEIQEKMDNLELAPDIQFIISEAEEVPFVG